MERQKLKYIYGPVPSWRLGSSLGIDPISYREKICTYDCIYCQIGKTYKFTKDRKEYVPVDQIIEEINLLPSLTIDYITFSGAGEPTLAENLGKMISAIKKLRKEKIAVLTNSSLMYRDDIIKDLSSADFVIAKLDAWSQKSFEIMNKPMSEIKFETVLEGIRQFRNTYKGRFALQIMCTKENKNGVRNIVELARDISPDEVQINTPLRPCRAKPLSKKEIFDIKKCFYPLNAISVYESSHKEVIPISTDDTLKRRGKI